MKITFNAMEASWLHYYINSLAVAAHKQGDDSTMRTATKMRYKFSSPSAYVSLGRKERHLIAELVNYRVKSVGTTVSDSEEGQVLASILNKLLGEQ